MLTFDDAARSHLSYVAPLLQKYGFGATFFVCQFPLAPEEFKKHYLSWPEIRQLHEMGFEIGNHTLSHPSVIGKSRAQLHGICEEFEKACAQHGIPRPVSFCYPFGSNSYEAVDVLKERGYLWARAAGGRSYVPNKVHPLVIPCFGAGGCQPGAFEWVLERARDGKITVLLFHGIPDTGYPNSSTDPELFENFLRYLKANGYRAIAMRDLGAYIDARKAMELITPVCMP